MSSPNRLLRSAIRLLWLGSEFLLAALCYLRQCAFCRRRELATARARWLHRSSRRVSRVFQLNPDATGAVPSSGLLVCNHLGYLDILVLAALAPCVFVAKRDVKRWPVLGWFAGKAGTIFVARDKRWQVGQTANEIHAALERGLLVVLFPEGTSSGGASVLPFKSSLLEPATLQSHPVTVACLQYRLDDGDASEEACYWKDMTLLPHLLNLLGKRAVLCSVNFLPIPETHPDRKQLAKQLHAEVSRLHDVLPFRIPEASLAGAAIE